MEAIDKEWDLVCVVEITIEHMTGKTAIKSVMEMED